jgi:hypothetical protein
VLIYLGLDCTEEADSPNPAAPTQNSAPPTVAGTNPALSVAIPPGRVSPIVDLEASTPSPHRQAPSPSGQVPSSSKGEGVVGRLVVTPDDSLHQLKLEAMHDLAADKPPHVHEKHTRLPVSFTCRHAKRSIDLMHC